jgi:putative endonuclease
LKEKDLIASEFMLFCHSRGGGNPDRLKNAMKQYFLYILASKKNGTLYVGVTGDLLKRIYEHKQNIVEGFTKKYNVHTLVYYERYSDIVEAITREKQIKKWNRKWKLKLIEDMNPEWKDLYAEIS